MAKTATQKDTRRIQNWAQRQKAKGIKLELQAYPARGCWKKRHNHKIHYFKHPISKVGYEAALLEWVKLKAEIDLDRPNAASYHHHKELFADVQAWYDSHGAETMTEKKNAAQVDKFLVWIDEQLLQPELCDSLPFMLFTSSTKNKEFYAEFIKTDSGHTLFGNLQYLLPAKWQERLNRAQTISDSKRVPQTVGYWCEDFLRLKGAKTQSGQLSKKTLMDSREKLLKFRNWIGDDSLMIDITTETIKNYYMFLLQQPFNNKGNYFNYAKSFIRYCWREDACKLENLPKNIDDRNLSFRATQNKKKKHEIKRDKLWTKEDFKKIFDKNKPLPQRYQCYLMLMLNCGFTQIDLEHLKRDEIDLDTGRIVRVRTKAENYDNPPMVNYKLWDTTIELLKKEMERCKHTDNALCAYRQARIINEHIVIENGKTIIKRNDNLSRNWQDIRAEYGFDGKLLKYIRKTGSTSISMQYSERLEQMYLGQTHVTVSDKHYNIVEGEPHPLLDEAVAWLGKQFGF
ncbi:MAG: hypothetical protein CME33_15370 [Gimesia sp.]|uniref:hypothetical protein n=1 Tax=Gimesia sp. TaxID=2024833 RepID=UPI000C3F3A8E|nr:hypothetical protein [Gimesia sp.]MAX37934.1 hypothetical protein [Gimesia sp.]|tara:strand:+ start:187 stop:1728 length:1542 start_codon:yes stop_codon:yes gene_type:complete